MRCAYPGCKSEAGDAIETIAGRVHRCRTCGRLLVACPTDACRRAEILNRPSLPYCRHCGLKTRDEASAWEKVRRDSWDRVPNEVTGPIEIVFNLSKLEGAARPEARVTFAIVPGALAVHQSGVGLALLNPLQTSEDQSLWSAREPFPGDGREPPFDPRVLPGGRRVIFSGPRGIAALDLWGCQGLAALGDAWLASLDLSQHPLAAPPVPLGPDRIGLIRGRPGPPFHWGIWDLSRGPDDDGADRKPAEVELPIEGSLCQAELIDGRLLALTTPVGHWVWGIEDALACRTGPDRLRRTWPPPGPGPNAEDRLELDPQVRKPQELLGQSQAFLLRASHGPSGTAAPSFEWFYRVVNEANRTRRVECYTVGFATLDSTPSRQVRSGATPLGPSVAFSGTPEMILLTDNGDLYRVDAADQVTFCQAGPGRDPSGIRLFDPLVLGIIANDPLPRQIRISSLRHPGHHATIANPALRGDPLVWSRWLFTVETIDGDEVKIARRELSSHSGRSGDHRS